MPPKRKVAVKKTKEEKAEARKKKKLDVDADNDRNMLLREFGQDAVYNHNTKQLYSESQKQEELFLRVFERQRGREFKERIRTVTVGLVTVLKCTEAMQDIVDRFTDLVNFFSKARIYASLFANYVILTRLAAGTALPAVEKLEFFRNCFDVVLFPNKEYELSAEFAQFSATTGITAIEWEGPGLVKEIKNDQAKKLTTAAVTRMDLFYEKRIKAIAKWVLRAILQPFYPEMQRKVFTKKIQSLVDISTSPNRDLDAKMAELGFTARDRDAIAQFFVDAHPVGESTTARIAHWYALQRKYLDEPRRAFELWVKRANERFPGKEPERREKRSEFLKRKFPHPAPPKIVAALPLAHPGAAFIRIDKATMKSHFPALDVQSGPWGYLSYLDPYSKAANIRCLCTSSWGRSKHSFLAAIRDADLQKCPWLLAPTFETDGRQIKLGMMSSEGTRPAHHGIGTLHKAGYQLGKDMVTLEASVYNVDYGMLQVYNYDIDADTRSPSLFQQEMLRAGAGAYNMAFVVPDPQIDDAYIGGVDPGIIKPVQAIFAYGRDWTEERLPDAVTRTGHGFEYYEVTEKDVAKGSKRFRINASESAARARGTPYGEAIERLKRCRKRTSDVEEFLRYCWTWKSVEDAYWQEILRPARRIHRFARFRLVQRQASTIAKGLCARLRAAGKAILVFGDGSLRAMRGHISVPTKMVVRACACLVPTVIPSEFGSSKYCCVCVGELRNLNSTDGRRTRVCSNPLCRLVGVNLDRDDSATGGITMKFVRHMRGQPDIYRRRRRGG